MDHTGNMSPGGSPYSTQDYWRKRSDMLYYRYIDYMVRAVGVSAKSMIDVGSGNCPYLDWFDWIPERVSVDIRVPYQSASVKPIKGDIFKLDFGKKFDLCSCLQVLEHVPDARRFARRLLELSDLVVISVPYKWTGTTVGHVHDPVDYEKVSDWMGRQANYKIVVEEPFQGSKHKRLICVYDVDPNRKFGRDLAENRITR
jgi:hypothetical protein